MNCNIKVFLLALVASFILGSCARGPIKEDSQAMRLSSGPLELRDDLALANLVTALRANIERLKATVASSGILRFGAVEIPKAVYAAELERLVQALDQPDSGEAFYKLLKDEFEFHEVYGGDSGWGSVFITSYYEPVIEGRLKKKAPFTQPIYGRPKDLVTVDMGAFAEAYPQMKSYHESVIVQKSRDGMLRGRLLAANEDPLGRTRILPYYSREEIDAENRLDGRAPVICYVDPVDAFFLQIQGSGRVHLTDLGVGAKTEPREIRVGYAEQNGHPYLAVGKFLTHVIPKEKMSAQKIAAYLKSLPQQEAQKVMGLNPSYIFFQKQEMAAVTSFGTEAVAGRTIATDTKYFPKGALAFLDYEKPSFLTPTDVEPSGFTPSSRFVLDQDTGGAIRGPGRVDLFWGSGAEAAQVSGVMRNPGRLHYILPKRRAL
jgi:membrane-bound lytic murein transglycosylase A